MTEDGNYLKMRTTPYSEDELRVCEYLQKIVPDVGCGDDPIGFMLTQVEWFKARVRRLEATLRVIRDHPSDATIADHRRLAHDALLWAGIEDVG